MHVCQARPTPRSVGKFHIHFSHGRKIVKPKNLSNIDALIT